MTTGQAEYQTELTEHHAILRDSRPLNATSIAVMVLHSLGSGASEQLAVAY